MQKIEWRKVLQKWLFRLLRDGDPQLLEGKDDDRPGARGETVAARYLHRKKYRILARNVLNCGGEIDVIAVFSCRGRRILVFVEVKTWSKSYAEGGPADAVDERKQRQLTRAALVYLREHNLLNQPVRFDVIEVILEDGAEPHVRHFENAFEAVGDYQLHT